MTEAVQLSHMGWSQDAATIDFGPSKTDQEGEKPKYPRHVYANPFNVRQQLCLLCTH